MTLQIKIIRSIKAAIAAAALAIVGTGFAVAQTVTITASPTSGVSPLDTTISWTATGVTSCTKSGAWTGTAALTGSQDVTVNAGTSEFRLTCVGPVEPVTVSWVAPTDNTDGTPLIDLSHYNIFHASTPTAVSSTLAPTRVNAPASSFVFNGLPVGPRCFAMNANNTAGISSMLTVVVCKTGDVTQTSATGAATVVATPRPNPPTGVTVAVVTGMNRSPVYGLNAAGTMGTSLRGFAALDVECTGPVVSTFRGASFQEISPADVQWWGSSSRRTAAACKVPAPEVG